MVVRLSATDLETGRRLAARKAANSRVRILPEVNDLLAIARIERQIRELLWHPDIAENIRAAHSLLRQQARLRVGYERRYGKPADTKHFK